MVCFQKYVNLIERNLVDGDLRGELFNFVCSYIFIVGSYSEFEGCVLETQGRGTGFVRIKAQNVDEPGSHFKCPLHLRVLSRGA